MALLLEAGLTTLYGDDRFVPSVFRLVRDLRPAPSV